LIIENIVEKIKIKKLEITDSKPKRETKKGTEKRS
jgi:hypothetical protein